MRSICVFCGSKSGDNPAYMETARELGETLAGLKIGVVYGGGGRGLMGAVAAGALEHGGNVYGVIPTGLLHAEAAQHELTELKVVSSMHERKAAMADKANAFVALPGGIGTMEELFEMWTWNQLGFQEKPCAVINVAGYFDPLLEFIERMTKSGFVSTSQRELLCVVDTPQALVERWSLATPP